MGMVRDLADTERDMNIQWSTSKIRYYHGGSSRPGGHETLQECIPLTLRYESLHKSSSYYAFIDNEKIIVQIWIMS